MKGGVVVGRATIALALSIAVWGAACDAPPSADPTTTPPTTAPASSDPGPPDEAWALWPENTREATDAAGREGEDAEALTRRFAGEILGWTPATIEDYDGPINCREDGCLAVRPAPAAPGVLVQLREVSDGIFYVYSLGPLDGSDILLGLSVQGDGVRVVFELGDAESAEFGIGFGDCGRRLTYTDDADDTFTLGCQPASSGGYMLLFKDADGRVTRAVGSALPEGDFAAG